MKIIKQHFFIEQELDEKKILQAIEKAGRTCYKSEQNISEDSAKIFVKSIIKRGHESVIEHEKITLRVICDRGVSHEIIRHRIASYSQESTRYCNYCNEKFGNEITFIEPCFFKSDSNQDLENKKVWLNTMQLIEDNYNKLIKNGAKPEEARAILPNSLKTEIIITMNLRAWRHFLKLRTDKSAHPQIRELSNDILATFKEKLPTIFEDL